MCFSKLSNFYYINLTILKDHTLVSYYEIFVCSVIIYISIHEINIVFKLYLTLFEETACLFLDA